MCGHLELASERAKLGTETPRAKAGKNIMRIAQNGFVEMVNKNNMLIFAWRFKVKLRSEKMPMSARPTKSQIERIVGFEF